MQFVIYSLRVPPSIMNGCFNSESYLLLSQHISPLTRLFVNFSESDGAVGATEQSKTGTGCMQASFFFADFFDAVERCRTFFV